MRCTVEFLSGAKKGQVIELEGERFAMGRNPTNTIQFDPIADIDVSGDHAQLVVGSDGRLMLTDLGSRNGTFLNGQKIGGTVPCPPGATLQFGRGGPEVRVTYTPQAKPGATRVLLAQVQQDLEMQKAAAEQSKKKTTLVAVIAVVILALGGTGGFLHIQHTKKKTAAEAAMTAAMDEKERFEKADVAEYAKDELEKAATAEAEARAYLDEGKYEDAKAAFEQAKKAYAAAVEAGEKRRNDEQLRLERERNEAIARELEEKARQQREEQERQLEELRRQGEAARAELERQEARRKAPQAILEQYQGSIGLISVRTYVTPEGTNVKAYIEGGAVEGTGFAVSPTRIVTAKHVVQPWKYDPRVLARVKKIKEERKLDVHTQIEVFMQKTPGGAFEKVFDTDAGTVKIAAIAPDVKEQADREPTIEWNTEDVKVKVRVHEKNVEDMVALEVTAAQLTPVELAPLSTAVKGEPVVLLGTARDKNNAIKPTFYTPTAQEVTDDSILLTTPLPSNFAGGAVFTIEKKCVGIIGGIDGQNVTVLSAEKAANLSAAGSTLGGAEPSSAAPLGSGQPEKPN